jgi:23S rRNA (guanosine2251-2'-O)-methyltransferase
MTRTGMAHKVWDPRHSGPKPARPSRPPRRRPPPHPHSSRSHGGPQADRVLLYGWHPVLAALENPRRRIRKLLVTENALRRLKDRGTAVPVEPQLVSPNAFSAYVPTDAVHQGMLAEADPLPSLTIEDLPDSGIVLALDQVTDPHNVGAILRSAAAFGAVGLITTMRHSPEATGVLAKSASGALEHVPMVAVPNLARGIAGLKARGFWTIGLDSEAEADLSAAPLRSPLALVLGAEGRGLRQLTRTSCDGLAKLALSGPIKSLNVSNAAALALYIANTRLSSDSKAGMTGPGSDQR